jgi:hypothetical protein
MAKIIYLVPTLYQDAWPENFQSPESSGYPMHCGDAAPCNLSARNPVFLFSFDRSRIDVVRMLTTWSNDATNQLTGEERSGTNSYDSSYVYDPAGNRLVKVENGGPDHDRL